MLRRGLLSALQSRVSRLYGRTQTQRLCLGCQYVDDSQSEDRKRIGPFHRHYAVDMIADAGGSTSNAFKKGKKLLEEVKLMVQEGDMTAPTKAVVGCEPTR